MVSRLDWWRSLRLGFLATFRATVLLPSFQPDALFRWSQERKYCVPFTESCRWPRSGIGERRPRRSAAATF